MAKLTSLAAALLLYSPAALAWGGLGHEAICELAFLELDDTARQRVMELIRQDQEFARFAHHAIGPIGHGSGRPSTSSISRGTRLASMTMSARWLTSVRKHQPGSRLREDGHGTGIFSKLVVAGP